MGCLVRPRCPRVQTLPYQPDINESKEDGELVAPIIATAMLAHRIMHPEHTEVMLRTDGAGCYNGLHVASARIQDRGS
jgi:hypothetical protein